ncbi:hypothetical protein Tco_1508316 [Tanacetum coccineum]
MRSRLMQVLQEYPYTVRLLHLAADFIAPPSPDYVPDPKHPPSPDYMPSPKHPPLPVYVPELEYPEYLVPSGDEAPIEDQPPPADASPTALSLGYMADSDSEEYPEEDPEEDHANYPADGGDGDDEPSDDDDDDDDDADDEDEEASEDEDNDEEEEHLAIPSPPLPVSSPLLPLLSPLTTNPTDAKVPLGYRAARIRIRATSPPLLLLSTSYRTDIPEAEMPPRKRVSFILSSLTLSGIVVGRVFSSSACCETAKAYSGGRPYVRQGYGITNTWDEIVEAMLEITPTILEGFNQRTQLRNGGPSRTLAWRRITRQQEDSTAIARTKYKCRDFYVIVLRRHSIVMSRRLEGAIVIMSDRIDEVYLTPEYDSPIGSNGYLARRGWAAMLGCTLLYEKMAPKKITTRTSPATTTTTTTPMTNAQIKALINQGVDDALAERDAERSQNSDDNYDLGTGGRRQVVVHSCRRVTESAPWREDIAEQERGNYGSECNDMRRDKRAESDVVEKYVDGLPNMIHGSVKASKPKTMQEAIEFATELMDKKILTLAERQSENKRKNLTEDLNLCAPNATITMMGSVLPSALTAKGLAIRPMTVKAGLLLSTTTREPKRQIKEFSLALSVELRVISGAEDKSKEKRLEDVPIVQDFPEQPVAQAPYRLALSEMKELSDQLKELSDKGFIIPTFAHLGVYGALAKSGRVVSGVVLYSGWKHKRQSCGGTSIFRREIEGWRSITSGFALRGTTTKSGRASETLLFWNQNKRGGVEPTGRYKLVDSLSKVWVGVEPHGTADEVETGSDGNTIGEVRELVRHGNLNINIDLDDETSKHPQPHPIKNQGTPQRLAITINTIMRLRRRHNL